MIQLQENIQVLFPKLGDFITSYDRMTSWYKRSQMHDHPTSFVAGRHCKVRVWATVRHNGAPIFLEQVL